MTTCAGTFSVARTARLILAWLVERRSDTFRNAAVIRDMRPTKGLLISACAFLGACSSGTAPASAPPPVDHDVQGSWGENFAGAPGNTFLIAVTESAGRVAGTGSFAGEAGPYGALEVSGTVANDSLHLQIIYDFEPTVFRNLHPDTTHFVGRLTHRDSISGQLTRDGSTAPLELVRLKIGDPP